MSKVVRNAAVSQQCSFRIHLFADRAEFRNYKTSKYVYSSFQLHYCLSSVRWLSGRASDWSERLGGSIPTSAMLCP